ncbi:hypothetical protein ACZ87_02902, partial [Candidatus Erwinia dacicola]
MITPPYMHGVWRRLFFKKEGCGGNLAERGHPPA